MEITRARSAASGEGAHRAHADQTVAGAASVAGAAVDQGVASRPKRPPRNGEGFYGKGVPGPHGVRAWANVGARDGMNAPSFDAKDTAPGNFRMVRNPTGIRSAVYDICLTAADVSHGLSSAGSKASGACSAISSKAAPIAHRQNLHANMGKRAARQTRDTKLRSPWSEGRCAADGWL
jgi:hypothetical protein